MPLPRSIVAYAAGTDTRVQFTTPPDPRQVADLVDAHSVSIEGGQLCRDTYFSTALTVSSSSWTVVPVTSGGIKAAHSGWNTTYDCWQAPTDWFDEFTYVWVDMPWTVNFPDWSGGNSNSSSRVQFRVRASPSSGTVVSTHEATWRWQTRFALGVPEVVSGCQTVRLQTSHVIEMRLHQSSGTSMTSVNAMWGVRIVGGHD